MPVANFSYGSHESSPTQLRALRIAAKRAFLEDRVLVASSGTLRDSIRSYPAGLDAYVMAVGAVLWNNNYWTTHNAWSASSDSINGSRFGSWVDIVAPGGLGITAARPGLGPGGQPGMYTITGSNPPITCDLSYCSFNPGLCSEHGAFGGTSAAAPFVAGAASYLRQFKPTLTAEDVVEVLKRTATDLGAPGFDVFFGNGRVNLASAVDRLSTDWVEHGLIEGAVSAGLEVLGDSLTISQLTLVNAEVNGTILNGTFPCVRYHLSGQVQFSAGFSQAPQMWIRRAESAGLPATGAWDHDADVAWAGISQLGASSATVETYVYRLTNQGNAICPVHPDAARIAYTAFGPSGTLDAPPASTSNRGALHLRPSTNPSRGRVRFEAAGLQVGPVRIEVFDLMGRKAAVLFEGRVTGEQTAWTWEGDHQNGAACPPGVYVCRIEQPGRRSACRFALLR